MISDRKININSHWNRIYSSNLSKDLGWYEEIPDPSIELIHKTDINKKDNVLLVGAGMTTLVDWLVINNYSGLHVNDISEDAIRKLQTRLGAKSNKVQWIVDDLTSPKKLENMDKVKLWLDRAVLHFFNDTDEQDAYFKLLKSLVSPGGFVIIGAFSKEGEDFCSGLPVVNYSLEMLTERLDKNFYLIDSFHYTHRTPTGQPRPYIYTLFKRHLFED